MFTVREKYLSNVKSIVAMKTNDHNKVHEIDGVRYIILPASQDLYSLDICLKHILYWRRGVSRDRFRVFKY